MFKRIILISIMLISGYTFAQGMKDSLTVEEKRNIISLLGESDSATVDSICNELLVRELKDNNFKAKLLYNKAKIIISRCHRNEDDSIHKIKIALIDSAIIICDECKIFYTQEKIKMLLHCGCERKYYNGSELKEFGYKREKIAISFVPQYYNGNNHWIGGRSRTLPTKI